MDVSGGLLLIGTFMVIVGTIFIYLSLRATPTEINEKKDRILYIGSLPIVVYGERKWIIIALFVTTIVILYFVIQPGYLGLLGVVRVG
jgi:uncharacterized membrane protein